MPSSRGAGSTHSPEPSAKPMSPDVNTGAGGVASACTPRVGRATATTATSTATASQVRRRETSLIRVPPPRVRLALDKPPGRPGPTVAETPAARGTANRRTRARWLGLVRGQRDGRGTRLGAGVAGPGGDAGRVVDGEGAVRGTPDVRRVRPGVSVTNLMIDGSTGRSPGDVGYHPEAVRGLAYRLDEGQHRDGSRALLRHLDNGLGELLDARLRPAEDAFGVAGARADWRAGQQPRLVPLVGGLLQLPGLGDGAGRPEELARRYRPEVDHQARWPGKRRHMQAGYPVDADAEAEYPLEVAGDRDLLDQRVVGAQPGRAGVPRRGTRVGRDRRGVRSPALEGDPQEGVAPQRYRPV